MGEGVVRPEKYAQARIDAPTIPRYTEITDATRFLPGSTNHRTTAKQKPAHCGGFPVSGHCSFQNELLKSWTLQL